MRHCHSPLDAKPVFIYHGVITYLPPGIIIVLIILVIALFSFLSFLFLNTQLKRTKINVKAILKELGTKNKRMKMRYINKMINNRKMWSRGSN